MTWGSFPIAIDEKTKLIALDLKYTEEFFALIDRNRPYLREWLGWLDNIQTISSLRDFIQTAIKDYPEKKSLQAWIKHSDTIIGIIHLREINWTTKKAMIGYWIDQDHRGQGFTTKACEAIIYFAFQEWRLNKLEIRCAMENTSSHAIPKKLGFLEDGIVRNGEWLYDHYVDHVVFSKTLA